MRSKKLERQFKYIDLIVGYHEARNSGKIEECQAIQESMREFDDLPGEFIDWTKELSKRISVLYIQF